MPFKRMLLDQWNMHCISYPCCYDPEFSMKLHRNLLLKTGILCWKLMKHLFESSKAKATHVNVKGLWSSIWGLVIQGCEAALPQVWTMGNVCAPRCFRASSANSELLWGTGQHPCFPLNVLYDFSCGHNKEFSLPLVFVLDPEAGWILFTGRSKGQFILCFLTEQP